MIAVGKIDAEGSLYRFLWAVADADVEAITLALEETVPWYLSWVKEAILRFL